MTEEILPDPPVVASPEASATKEVSKKQQAVEAQIIGSTLLRGRYEQTAGTLRKGSVAEATAFFDANPGMRAVATLVTLDGLNADSKYPQSLTDKPITTTNAAGQEARINQIVGRNGNNFLCMVEGESKPVPIPRSEVFAKQLGASQEEILPQFEGDEKKAIELYIATAIGRENALAGRTPEEVNQLVEAAAKQAGVLTVDDIKAAVDKMLPEIKPEDPAQQLTTEQQAQNAKRARMVEALDKSGKNIVDQEVLTAVFNSEGLTPAQLAQQAQNAQTRAVQAQARLSAEPTNQEARQALAAAQAESTLIGMAQEATKADGPMNTYLERMARGEIPPEQGRAAVAAFREGNLIPLIEMAQPELTPNPADTAAEAAEKAAKKKALENAAKKSGNIFLYLLAVMVLSTQAVTTASGKIA